MAILVVEIPSDGDAVALKSFLDKAQFKSQIRFGFLHIDHVRFAGEELPADETGNKDSGNKLSKCERFINPSPIECTRI